MCTMCHRVRCDTVHSWGPIQVDLVLLPEDECDWAGGPDVLAQLFPWLLVVFQDENCSGSLPEKAKRGLCPSPPRPYQDNLKYPHLLAPQDHQILSINRRQEHHALGIRTGHHIGKEQISVQCCSITTLHRKRDVFRLYNDYYSSVYKVWTPLSGAQCMQHGIVGGLACLLTLAFICRHLSILLGAHDSLFYLYRIARSHSGERQSVQ